MRRYEIVHMLARRLSLKVGRVQAILGKLQEAQLISSPGPAKGYPVDMAEPEIVTLLVALLGESGVTSAPDAARRFGALYAEDTGERFDLFLEDLIFGRPKHVRHLLVRLNPDGVSVTVDTRHVLFGEPPSTRSASPARIVPGEAIAAIAAELQGQTPEQADAAAEIVKLTHSLRTSP